MMKEINMSDQILTVAGIKVLTDIENKSFQKVKESVEKVQQSVNQVSVKQEDFWSNLSKDGVISRAEKKQLRKEYEGMDQTHTALMNQAVIKGCEHTKEVIEYDFSFLDLHDYLFETLKLFDDMGKDTPIESVEVFNSYYNDYAFKLQNAQSRVNIGDPGKIRTLTSLMDEGIDGEVALYEDNFYRYDLANHEWINIEVASSLGEYQGVLESSPPMIPNQYFLVGPAGIVADTLLFDLEQREMEDNAWVDHNGELIYINYGFEVGFIYYFEEQTKKFVKVEDKNNWRYIIAMNDMIENNFGISPELYDFITKNVAEEIEKKTEENVLKHIPKYLGKCTEVPDANNNDWMLWATTTTSRFIKGHLYMYQAETQTWEELNPSNPDGKVQEMFMTALNDILTVNPTETGYFATVFANSFYSNIASIGHLNASQIELQQGGYIKSHGYVAGQKGFKINDDGKAEFNEVIIGGYATEEQVNEVEVSIEGIHQVIGEDQQAILAATQLAEAAQEAASTADGKAEAAQTAADDAKSKADDADRYAGRAWNYADDAFREATNAGDRATIADGKAVTAKEAADDAKTAAEGAQTAADDAKSRADDAQYTAGQAWDFADGAYKEANNASDRATIAEEKADAAQEAADDAKTAADDAKTAADDAKTATDDIKQGNVALDKLHGEILQDASDPDGWALRTKDFDPLTSTSGYGIRKNGNFYANNGVFRGTVYASDGVFNGVLSVGSQRPTESGTRFIEGTYVGDGVIDTARITANESLRIKDHCVFENGYIRFLSVLATRWCTEYGKPNDMTDFAWLKYWLFPLTESLEPNPCFGGIRLSLAAGPQVIEGIAVNIGYTSEAKNAIAINIISVNNAQHYTVKIKQSGGYVTIDDQPYNLNSYYLGTISSVRP